MQAQGNCLQLHGKAIASMYRKTRVLKYWSNLVKCMATQDKKTVCIKFQMQNKKNIFQAAQATLT